MIYVLSDIHGNLKNFQSILDQIKLQPDDTLYILGDVIDRHPHGIEILQKIMAMPNAHMLLGNHEYMMMDTLGFPYEENGYTTLYSSEQLRQLWYQNGGEVTHKAWNKASEETRRKITAYLKALPLNIDVEAGRRKFKLVHAAAVEIYEACRGALEESRAFFCVWDRETILGLQNAESCVTIFGHTPTAYFQNCNPLEIYYNHNIIGIDCGSGWPAPNERNPIQGRLACLRLDDMKEYYSEINNQE